MMENMQDRSNNGAEDPEDVLGKLDHLLYKHRKGTTEPGAAPVPELTESQQGAESTGSIPTLEDMVSGPAWEVSPPQQVHANSTADAKAILEAGINLRLAINLESERARLLERAGNDPVRAQAIDQLVTELKRSLPAAVRSAMAEDSPALASRPQGDRR